MTGIKIDSFILFRTGTDAFDPFDKLISIRKLPFIFHFSGADGATAIDENLFEDEDLDELEEDMNNLDV